MTLKEEGTFKHDQMSKQNSLSLARNGARDDQLLLDWLAFDSGVNR